MPLCISYYLIMSIFLLFFTVCNIIVHEKCLKTVSLPCVSVAATLVKVSELVFVHMNLFLRELYRHSFVVSKPSLYL